MEKNIENGVNRTRDLSAHIQGIEPAVGVASSIPHQTRHKQGLGPRHTGRPKKLSQPAPDVAEKVKQKIAPPDALLRTATYQSNKLQQPRELSKPAHLAAKIAIGAGVFTLMVGGAEIILKDGLETHNRQDRRIIDASGVNAEAPTLVQKRLGQSISVFGDEAPRSGVKIGKDRYLTVQSEESTSADCNATMVAPARGGRNANRSAESVSRIGDSFIVLRGDNLDDKPLLSGVKPVELSETVSFEPGETIFTASGPTLTARRVEAGTIAAGVVLGSRADQKSGEAFALMDIGSTGQEATTYAGRGVYDGQGEFRGMLGSDGYNVSSNQAESMFHIDLESTTGDGWMTIVPVVPFTEQTLAGVVPAPGQPIC